jgi:5-methyltetrahydropteroyltriglutamate--homocysteine methyltransferase
MLETSIVGSLPKPSWLAEPNVLRAPWRLTGRDLLDAQQDAIRLAILDQEEAGLDVVTDGEVARRHYIWGFLAGLTGIDTEQLGRRRSRGGRYSDTTEVARIIGPVEHRTPVFVEACTFSRALTSRRLKVTLPGPMTIADSVADEYYGVDQKTLAMRFADILNAEARALVEAGADVIQIDEPCFNIYLDEVEAWGVEALERCLDGVGVTRAVHICYGYGTPLVIAWKSRNTDWGHYGVTLPLLARSSVDQVSVECAASGVDLAVLGALAGKDVLLGVIDVGTDEVESPEVVAGRIRSGLEHVPPARLFPCTDCGLVPRSRAAAREKLRALAAGAALVRAELRTGGEQGAGRPRNYAKTALFP